MYISVLIPVYEHNANELILELYKQFTQSKLIQKWEIRVYDDASPNVLNCWETAYLPPSENIILKKLNKNIGRSKIRNLLAKEAKYDFLIFLDGDSLPNQNLIEKYIIEAQKGANLICGGVKYFDEAPQNEYLLHWNCGKNREEKKSVVRQNKPYLSFTFFNLMIQKNIFLSFPLEEKFTQYGHEDTYWGILASEKNIKITHIDNFAFHLGLEKNDIFLFKTQLAIQNLNLLYKLAPNEAQVLPLIQLVLKFKKLRLFWVLKLLANPISYICKKIILLNPKFLFFFDLFKLSTLVKYLK